MLAVVFWELYSQLSMQANVQVLLCNKIHRNIHRQSHHWWNPCVTRWRDGRAVRQLHVALFSSRIGQRQLERRWLRRITLFAVRPTVVPFREFPIVAPRGPPICGNKSRCVPLRKDSFLRANPIKIAIVVHRQQSQRKRRPTDVGWLTSEHIALPHFHHLFAVCAVNRLSINPSNPP